MEPLESSWSRRSLPSLEQLTRHFWLLLGLMLLLNALVLPYRGFFHDARLYAVQLKERLEPGSMKADLFLRYGSQDSYSAFSVLMLPLARLVGMEAAFFLVYLASKVLFFAALIRLVLLLVPDRRAALAALVYLAISPLPWGGNEIFHLNEPFLTPRIAASALVLLAVERALLGKPWQSVLCLIGSFLLHPLMAFGGALVLALWGLSRALPLRWYLLLGGLTVLAGGLVVCYPPLGFRVFGHVDDEWRQINLSTCFFIDPASWSLGDWARIGCAFLVTAAAALTFARTQAPFLSALLLSVLLGLIGSLVAVHSNYLLLLQVSPYRTIWLLEVLAVPLAFWACSLLWAQRTNCGRLTSAALLLAVTTDWNWNFVAPVWVFAVLLVICGILLRGLRWTPAVADWLRRSARAALIVTGVLLLLFDGWFVAGALAAKSTPTRDLHPLIVAQVAGIFLYKLPLVGLFLAFLARVSCLAPLPALRLGLFSLWLGYQGLIAWAESSPWYAHHYSDLGRRAQLIKEVVEERGPTDRTPSVYWTADLSDVWFRIEAQCFFNTVQMSGTAFNRGTALEARRRSRLVRRFEGHYFHSDPLPEKWWQNAILKLFEMPHDELPTEEDLLGLAAEEGLDFVIVRQAFPGLYCWSDGRYYVYDCRELRSARTGRNASGLARAVADKTGGS